MPSRSSAAHLDFVEACYEHLLNRRSDEKGRQHFVRQLEAGATPAEVLREFAASAEYAQSGTANQWVPPGHFYSPYPSRAEVAEHRRTRLWDVTMAAVDLQDAEQERLMEECARFYPELPFQDSAGGGLRYGYVNSSYPAGDAIPLYSFIRHLRPRRIIEVGSGNSSCVILDTCERFLQREVELTFIEPYPDFLRNQVRPDDLRWARLIETRLQDVPLAEFEVLEARDILFIDSTHVSKLNSDVNFLFFELLPRLRPGVWVHIHDVFFPFEYPLEWHEEGRAWNEQYLLRAFLQYNDCFRIRFFNTYLMHRHAEWFARHMPRCLAHRGGSIWLERVR